MTRCRTTYSGRSRNDGPAALPAHHGDPFDRLLIAQAQLDNLTILTSDRSFAKYEVDLRWADN
jgi:PIN domain nuclease of toxin-antitoxin system